VDAAEHKPQGEAASPVFVGGSGRCGTTILGRTVGLHSNVFTFPDEPKFLAEMPGSLLEYARNPAHPALRQNFEKRIRGYFFRRWSEREQRDIGICSYVDRTHYFACVESLLDSFPAPDLEERYAQIRTFMNALYAPTVSQRGARRWCDDSPLTVLYLLDLAAIYPDFKFIHVIRDGRGVARSYCRLGWCPTMPAALRLWHSRVAAGRLMGRVLPGDNYLEVSFSALVSDPNGELDRILDFIGEPWDDAVAAHKLRPERASQFSYELASPTNRLFLALAGDWCDEFGWPAVES
jgi:hypothetical protein